MAELLHMSLYDHQPHHQGGGGTTMEPINAAAAIAAAPPNADGSVLRCPICLEDVEPRATTMSWSIFPCCNQPVHLACAKRALNDNSHCPMCRALIP